MILFQLNNVQFRSRILCFQLCFGTKIFRNIYNGSIIFGRKFDRIKTIFKSKSKIDFVAWNIYFNATSKCKYLHIYGPIQQPNFKNQYRFIYSGYNLIALHYERRYNHYKNECNRRSSRSIKLYNNLSIRARISRQHQ